MIHVGFTGTRFGMTFAQRRAVDEIVRLLATSAIGGRRAWTAHHGDCVGADSEFHDIAFAHGGRIIIHPGPTIDNSAGRDGDERLPALTHFARNRDIVAAADVMIATPKEQERQLRGGTWYTVDQSRKRDRALALVLPTQFDGVAILYSGAPWPTLMIGGEVAFT